ncbi:MAG: hypothetical protein ACTSRU_09835 [Candidatus Hodarchaeales archaeon]
MILVTVFCVMNVFAYGSQVFILPYLTSLFDNPELQPAIQVIVGQMTRKW